MVVTHGTNSAFWTGMTLEDMKTLAGMGAYIEHCLHVMMPLIHRLTPTQLVETITSIGAENCIVSTDFGQDFHPMPPEGMRRRSTSAPTTIRCTGSTNGRPTCGCCV